MELKPDPRAPDGRRYEKVKWRRSSENCAFLRGNYPNGRAADCVGVQCERQSTPYRSRFCDLNHIIVGDSIDEFVVRINTSPRRRAAAAQKCERSAHRSSWPLVKAFYPKCGAVFALRAC